MQNSIFKRKLKICVALVCAAIVFPVLAGAQEAPLSQTELENQIRARTQKLEEINREIETVQGNLRETQTQKESLTREVKTLDYSIRQLDLNIKADEITSQKLTFEVADLQYDLEGIGRSIEAKRGVIAELLRELYRNEKANFLVLILRHGRLTESIAEAQSLGSLREQLALDIQNLKELSGVYGTKLDNVTEKQGEIHVRQENLKNRKYIVEDKKSERESLLTVTKNKETIYEKQVEDLKEQQEKISSEIEKIEDELRASFNVSLLPVKRPGALAWPLQGGRVTQHFGEKSYLYRGRPHNGLDIGVPIGTPVFAAEDGKVWAVDDNDRSRTRKYQYGKYIVIRHDNNFATLYAHLSRWVVSEGQVVKRGDLIGYSGSTGYATGPHLHFGLYWAPSITYKAVPPAAGLVPVGVIINPEDYL